MKKLILATIVAHGLAHAAFAQSSSGTWNDLPDRFQIDTGYYRISADSVLRFEGGQGGGGEVDFENDLGLDQSTDTFWVDSTWRVGRRHQLKLAFTRSSRNRDEFTLQRDISWGGQTYEAGLEVSAETTGDILGGYYRFAIVRNERFEIGPAVGIGYLWLDARIRATASVGSASQTRDRSATTGSITGAVGGYAIGWLTLRLLVQGDFLYIKVSPEDSEASVTDWRLGANYYFFRNAGLGIQYKYDKYRYDRGLLSSELGGEVTYKGFQVFLTFRF
jgi:hypothetical protein